MSKEDYLKMGRNINGKVRWGCLVLVFLFVVIPLASCSGYYIYTNCGKKLLYTHETSQGYAVSVYQIGHENWVGLHRLLIAVDDKPLLKFSLMETADVDHSRYPKEGIRCDCDTDNQYKLNFYQDDTNRLLCSFTFNADFSEIQYAKCYYMEVLDDNIIVTKYDEIDLF